MLLPMFMAEALVGMGGELMTDLMSVDIEGHDYNGMPIRQIVYDIEERGNKALSAAQKDGFRIWVAIPGPSYVFRDVSLSSMSAYDAICRVADAVDCSVSIDDLNERTIVVGRKDGKKREMTGASISDVDLNARSYTCEPLTNIVRDVWKRANDVLYKTSGQSIEVEYPHIITNMSVCVPATNAMDAFRIVAKKIDADVSFDGYCLCLSVASENTAVARWLKRVRLDAVSISPGTRFQDGMESLCRQINSRCRNDLSEQVRFEYCGAQTNLPMPAVDIAGVSAFEAISNICISTRRTFACDAESRAVYIGLQGAEYVDRFKALPFDGGRYSGKAHDIFMSLLSDINANLERNDLLPVGASLNFSAEETTLCVDIEHCTTWEALEQFARCIGISVKLEYGMVRFSKTCETGK